MKEWDEAANPFCEIIMSHLRRQWLCEEPCHIGRRAYFDIIQMMDAAKTFFKIGVTAINLDNTLRM